MFPHEHEEIVPVVCGGVVVANGAPQVERLPIAAEQVRAWLPVEDLSDFGWRVKGGLAGSVAMAVLACAYGLVEDRQHLVSDQSACRGCLCAVA